MMQAGRGQLMRPLDSGPNHVSRAVNFKSSSLGRHVLLHSACSVSKTKPFCCSKLVRDFGGLRECGEEKESGGAFDLFGALKAVMLFRGP